MTEQDVKAILNSGKNAACTDCPTEDITHLIKVLHGWYDAASETIITLGLSKPGPLETADALRRSANMLESLATGLAQAKQERDTWKNRCEAAERDINKVSMLYRVNASNGKSYDVDLPDFSVSGGDTFNSDHQTTVYFSTASVNGYLKSKVVDATSVYNAGVEAGKSAGAKNKVTLSMDQDTSVGYGETVTLYAYAYYDGALVTSEYARVSGPPAVDTTSYYNFGKTAGANSLTISPSSAVTLDFGESQTVTATTTRGDGTSNTKTVTITAPAKPEETVVTVEKVEGETKSYFIPNRTVWSLTPFCPTMSTPRSS